MIPSADENKETNAFKKALNLLSAEGLDGAMMVVERELEKNPESWEASCAMADIMYLREMYGSALKCCEMSIKLNPNNAFAWNTKGNALYKLGRYEEAIFCYNQTIEIEPLFVRAWHNKKLALEIQIEKSTRKVSLSNTKSRDTRSRTKFTR